MPSRRACVAVRSEVGTPTTRSPAATRAARPSTTKAAVEPVPSPTTIPLSISSIARNAAARFSWSRSLTSPARVANGGDCAGVIRRVENVRTGDDGGSPGVAHLPGVFAAQSTVDLDHRVEAAFVAQTAQCADLRQHLRQKLLAAKAGVDGHDENYPAEFEHILDQRQRGRRVEHHPGGFSEVADVRQGAVQMDRGTRLAM